LASFIVVRDGLQSRSPPFAPMLVTPTAAIPITSFSPRPRKKRSATRFHHQRHDDESSDRRGAGFVGGQCRPASGIVRTIGNAPSASAKTNCGSFARSALRPGFGYGIELHNIARDSQLAPQVTTVSAERLRDELTKLLTEGAARRAFRTTRRDGALGAAAARSRAPEGS